MSGAEAIEVVEEVVDEGLEFLIVSSGGVGGNEAVGAGPERVVGIEGFGVGDVEVRGEEFSCFEHGPEGVGIDGSSAADVVED